MAKPPKPYDLLTLLMEVAQAGRTLEELAFYFPAGSSLINEFVDDIRRGRWRHCDCVRTLTPEGFVNGREAVEAIAAQRQNTDFPAQITAWRLAGGVLCECPRCKNLRRRAILANIPKDNTYGDPDPSHQVPPAQRARPPARPRGRRRGPR